MFYFQEDRSGTIRPRSTANVMCSCVHVQMFNGDTLLDDVSLFHITARTVATSPQDGIDAVTLSRMYKQTAEPEERS
jgi:hypothetical protein